MSWKIEINDRWLLILNDFFPIQRCLSKATIQIMRPIPTTTRGLREITVSIGTKILCKMTLKVTWKTNCFQNINASWLFILTKLQGNPTADESRLLLNSRVKDHQHPWFFYSWPQETQTSKHHRTTPSKNPRVQLTWLMFIIHWYNVICSINV